MLVHYMGRGVKSPVSCFIVSYYAEAGDVTAKAARLIGGAVQRAGAEASLRMAQLLRALLRARPTCFFELSLALSSPFY